LPAIDERRPCVLCGSPIPEVEGPDARFCCAGCERVHEVLSHLDDSARGAYVKAARRMGIVPAGPDGEAPPSADRPLPADPSALCEERFALEGMACPSCAWVAEQVLASQRGVEQVEADFFSGTARVAIDLRLTSADQLRSLLAPLGYRLRPLGDEARSTLSRSATLRFVVAAVITMNIMGLASVRYFEGHGYLDHAPEFLVWLELALTVPVLVIGWLPILRRALAALAGRRVTADLLIGTAVGAAAALSVAALLTGRDDIYLETCAGLVTITLLSQMIEAHLRSRAFGRLAGLLRMKVTRARRLAGGEIEYARIDDIGPGDLVVFEPGETIPFDGLVRGGAVHISEAVLTGEPRPIERVVGDTVLAGSALVEGRLELAVVRRYDQTRLHGITESLAESLGRAETRLRSADRISRWFVPAVLLVAVGAWLARLLLFGLDHALSADGWFPSVAVLAVACPCAFSLAGISAITAATGNLLGRGILVKEPAQLDRLAEITRVVFDKTGTLTEGRMNVERLVWRDAPREELLPLLLAVEQGSAHPAAHAIRASLGELDGADLEVRDLPGQGRTAAVDGGTFAVGSAALFADRFAVAGMGAGHSAVWFGFDGVAVGCFLLTDTIREETPAAVAGLGAMGLELELLSGDRQAVTEKVAAEVGIAEAHGDLTIEDKVAAVKGSAGSIAFVGDGTNDALAMAASDVSVAVAGSTDEALSAAGFVALSPGPRELPGLFALGKKLRRVIRANYVWAFAFNTLFIPIAAAGKLVPLAAMALMLVSSAAVLLNSLRVRG